MKRKYNEKGGKKRKIKYKPNHHCHTKPNLEPAPDPPPALSLDSIKGCKNLIPN